MSTSSSVLFPTKKFWSFGLAIALQNLLTLTTGLIDNVMLGNYSTLALAGATLGNQVQFILQMATGGLADGAVIIASQSIGAKQKRDIRYLFGILWLIGGFLSLVSFWLMFSYPLPIFRLISDDVEVLQSARSYTDILRYSYPIFIATQLLLAVLRSFGKMHIAYVISGITLGTNILFNSLLIYGRAGFDELGIRGAAYATLLSRIIALVISVVYFYQQRQLWCFSPITSKDTREVVEAKTQSVQSTSLSGKVEAIAVDYSSKLFWRFSRKFIKISLPTMLVQIMWGIIIFFHLAILGNYGKEIIVANSIAVVFSQLITVVIYGLGNGGQVLMGQAIGANDYQRVLVYIKYFKQNYLLVALATAILMWLARFLVPYVYPNFSGEVIHYISVFLLVQAVCSIGQGYQVPMDFSVIRAAGNTNFSFVMNMFTSWLFCIPVAAYLSSLQIEPWWVFFVLRSDQLIKVPIVAWRSHRFIRQVQHRQQHQLNILD